jgi:molybdenum cofactor synthesis domain-containing protein
MSTPKRERGPKHKPGVRQIRVEDAVGLHLAHDITEIRPGEFKGPAFHKGHKVAESDLCHLMRLGKRHLYVLDLGEDHVHEDEAALALARALAGPGIALRGRPKEGKLQMEAAWDGLFKVKVEPLVDFNLMQEMMCATIHTDTPVKAGQRLAGTRIIPLFVDRRTLEESCGLAQAHYPILAVKQFKPHRAALIITGNEVFDGLIEDRFAPIIQKKMAAYGSSLVSTQILPDDPGRIAGAIAACLRHAIDLIITTGGMSVDPDDVTRLAISRVGVDRLYYGAGALPGSMFLLAYKGQIPIMGVPACALYHEATIVDLILPRLLAGEAPDRHDLARLAHGGLCYDCPTCRFPACPFGK